MDIYYAVGSGLGHLQRARLFIEKIRLKNVVVLTTNDLADKILGHIPFTVLPRKLLNDKQALKKRLFELVEKFGADAMYLDTFPGGLIGEWCRFNNKKLTFYWVSRIIKIEEYCKIIEGLTLPFFKKVFICEYISDKQLIFIKQHCKHHDILYTNFEHMLKSTKENQLPSLLKKSETYWLVIHSGNNEECEVLLKHANDIANTEGIRPEIFLVHPQPQRLKATIQAKAFSSFALKGIVEGADKIITACGYNLMHELLAYKEKHIFVPFYRKYDNQFLRATFFKQGRFN